MFSLKYILVNIDMYLRGKVNIMEELYRLKYQYERFISSLNSSYQELNNCYLNLVKFRSRLSKTLIIDNEYFSKYEIDKIISTIELNKNKIINIVLPQARREYNYILIEIENYNNGD